MKKVLFTILAILSAMIGLIVIHHLYNRLPIIPGELRQVLERDMVVNFSIGTSGVLNPSLVDELIGFKGYRYRITTVNHIPTSDTATISKMCLKIRVVYRLPEKSSVYSPGSPTEDFLYLAWKAGDLWEVKKIRQSGINGRLTNNSCPETLDSANYPSSTLGILSGS